MRRIAGLGGSGGTLDYVAAWFIKAGQYMSGQLKPLPFRGGVGVGAVSKEQRPDDSPHP